MRIVFFFYIIINIGCTKSVIQSNKVSINKNSLSLKPIEEHDCSYIISQYLNVLEGAKIYYRYDHNISNNVTINSLIKCALDSNYISEKRVQRALLNYVETFIKFTKDNNRHPTIFNLENNIGKILSSIITKECFELHLRIFSYNDCVGHEPGTEQSTGVSYFEYMVLPFISTLNGIPADDFYKEYKFEYYFADFKDDCGQLYYDKLYNFIKQAWEDGKIELKESPINNR